jgi:hypothetical protein
MSGWIKLHRDIRNHWLMSNAEHFRAWCIMLMEVNFRPSSADVGGSVYHLEAGQSANSHDTWARIFGPKWNRYKVRRLFDKLEKCGQIAQQGDRKTTILTIVNWETYQNERTTDAAASAQLTAQQPPNSRPTAAHRRRREEGKKGKKEEKSALKPAEQTADFLWIHHSDKLCSAGGIEGIKADKEKCTGLIADYSFDHVEQSIIKGHALMRRPLYMSQVIKFCEEFAQ